MNSSNDSRAEFRRLHESGCFVMPNPWDVGSARVLEQLGFPALATTSSGFAWSLGRRDNSVSRNETIAHLRAMAEAVDVPVNADFEDGFATMPSDVARNVKIATTTGIAGLSIEDSTRRRIGSAVRLRARRRAHQCGAPRHRRERHRHSAHRALGRLHRRTTGSRRDDPASHRLCRGRGRLPVCARPLDDAGCVRGGQGASRPSR